MPINYNLRTWSEIDLDALDRNFDALSSCIPEGTKKLAVVKADAYGHGARKIATHIADRVDYFGVARADEAVELRREGIVNTRILILGHTAPFHYSVLFKHDLTPTVYNIDEARLLRDAADTYGQKLDIHIAVDTGMNRIGFQPDEKSARDICEIAGYENITISGVFSHFADADNGLDSSFTELQIALFRAFLKVLEDAGVNIPLKHLFNSAGIITLPPEFDMVREGICLYGLAPSDTVKSDILGKLTPVMSLRSEVIHIHNIVKGDAVSYGCRFVAENDMTVATVCAGYADGVPRALSNKGYVLVSGRRAKILGSVCMDQLMCDVTEIEGVHPGSVVTVFGQDGDAVITADDIARDAGTISYEILCGISKRVPRVYIKGGEVESIHYGIPHEEF